MTRTVTFYDSATQKKVVVKDIEASTLGELKAAAAAANAGIDFNNKSVLEGVSSTQLMSDSSPLPSEIEYQGKKTNDLMIFLTPNKKINSGCSDKLSALKEVKEKLVDCLTAVNSAIKAVEEGKEDGGFSCTEMAKMAENCGVSLRQADNYHYDNEDDEDF